MTMTGGREDQNIPKIDDIISEQTLTKATTFCLVTTHLTCVTGQTTENISDVTFTTI